MAATTMAATNCSTGQSDLIVNRSSESSSIEMNARFSQMQLKSSSTSSVSQSNSNSFSNHCMIPKRQPTIVCEDIADDDDIGNCTDFDVNGEEMTINDDANPSSLMRSASSVSLTVPVPVVCENEATEKRRPPMPSNN